MMDADAYQAELEKVRNYAPGAPTAAQGSPEWLNERLGHCTCSRFKDVVDFQKSGREGAKRAAYRWELVIERITGRPTEHYLSKPMQDGLDREPEAKLAYEARTGAMLSSRGFVHHKSLKWVGGSPDALVGDDGGLEIKAPTPATHAITLLNGMPIDHLPQVQGLIWIFDRAWWDFASYNPIFPEALQMHIQRVQRDDEYIKSLAAQIDIFLAEVDELHKRLLVIAAKAPA